MKHFILVLALSLFTGMGALAQKVTYNFDKSIDFSKYKTYQWVMSKDGRIASNPLLEKNLLQATDEALAAKGMTRVESNPDIYITYQARLSQETQLNTMDTGMGWGYGGGWGPGWGMGGGSSVTTTSTINVGTLVYRIADAQKKEIVWQGQGTDTLNPSKDPEKNYKKMQKSIAKILKDFPPKVKK